MTQRQKDIQELATRTKLHLLQEYNRNDWIMTDTATYDFFKEYALQKRSTPPKPATPPPPQVIIQKKPSAPQAPPPPKEVKKEPPKNVPAFKLTPPTATPSDDFADIRSMLATKMPNLAILEAPPDDSSAKQIRQQWRDRHKEPEIVILDVSQSPQQRAFLRNLTTALDLCLGPTRLMSAEDPKRENPKLRLVLGTKAPKHSAATYLELGDLDRFLHDSQQKAALWKKLSEFRASP